ncbi:MAG: ribbon-helix-helix domain-containing protein [Chthonomonadales bacterium]
MSSRTLKVTGVPQDLLALLDQRVKDRHALGRSEYIRELIRKDVLEQPSVLREVMAPVYEAGHTIKESEQELESLFNNVRDEIRAEKSA